MKGTQKENAANQSSKRYRIFFKGKTSRKREDQATKGLRRMPWYMAPKKDVTSCEKPRRGANILRPVDIRMRELSKSNILLLHNEQNSYARGTRGTETSKYPEEKKTKVIPRVVASEIGGAQTKIIMILGYGLRESIWMGSRINWKVKSKRVKIPQTKP